MGGGSSVPYSLNQSDAAIVKLMMPLYYTLEETTTEEHAAAQTAWNMVLNDTAPRYVQLKNEDPNFEYNSAVVFFHDSFYKRLFNIHPMARALFKSGMKSQGKFLVQMISVALSELKSKEKFDRTLKKLAEIHHQRSVKAIEYGIVGDILFWTLQNTLGEEVYTQAAHTIWIKIYSRMLQTIVPVAVSLELADSTAQQNRLNGETTLFTMSAKHSTTAHVSGGSEGAEQKPEA